MGGGKGGGAGKIPKEIEDTAQILRDIGVEQFDLGFPLIETGAGQAQELLTTGNVKALEPAIRQTVEGARSNESMGMQQLMEQLTQQGVTGTALQQALASGRMGAEQRVANVAPQFTAPFLSKMGGAAFGLPEAGLQGIGQAGQIAGMAAGPARGGGGGKSVGQVLGSVAGAAAGSFIAPGVGTMLGAQLGGTLGGAAQSAIGGY